MPFPKNCFFLALIAIFFVGCSGLKVDEAPLNPAQIPPENANPSPIGFNKVVFALPTGTAVASSSPQGLLGLIECEWPYGIIAQGSVRGRGFPTDGMREIFQKTMEGQGYDVTGSPGRLFDEEADLQRTIYSVGGRIIDIKMDTCQHVNVWGVDQGRTGKGHVEIEWSVFDLLNRKTVLKKTSRGYGTLKTPNSEGVALLFEEAVSAAIHNLGADKEFYNLVYFGELPNFKPNSYSTPNENPAALFDPDQKINIQTKNLSKTSAQNHLENIIESVVLVQKTGHGSGFFISNDGHILTNAHVVGNADRMRIVTSGKKYKLTAQVLRINRARDVALLQLESIPPGLQITPLPLRLSKTKIGEDVYAIGTPSYIHLQDTVTKGIISAHRIQRRGNLSLIQADADVHGGSSGGPLIDSYGNVIGIAVSNYIDSKGSLSGLNDFIPIEDALLKLGINLSDTVNFNEQSPTNLVQ